MHWDPKRINEPNAERKSISFGESTFDSDQNRIPLKCNRAVTCRWIPIQGNETCVEQIYQCHFEDWVLPKNPKCRLTSTSGNKYPCHLSNWIQSVILQNKPKSLLKLFRSSRNPISNATSNGAGKPTFHVSSVCDIYHLPPSFYASHSHRYSVLHLHIITVLIL